MQHDWIFEVLADLREYAEKNHLFAIEEALDLTSTVVTVQLQGLSKDDPERDVELPTNIVRLDHFLTPGKTPAKRIVN